MSKPARGGRRSGAGRPATTGSSETAPIQFRVSADQRRSLTRLGRRDELSADQAAKRIVIEALSPKEDGTP